MADTRSPHANVTVEELAPEEYPRRTVSVDFLFLDREVCDRCSETEESIHAALDRVAGLLDDLGVDVVVRSVHVESEADARKTGFEISPTIRIDGRDLQPDYVGTPCASCGALCDRGEGFDDDTVIDCRSWLYEGREYETPPVEFVVEALLQAAFVDRAPIDQVPATERYQLPENLQHFFGTVPDSRGDATVDVGSVTDGESCC